MTTNSPLKVGDRLPNFTLPSASGDNVNIADFIGKQPLVIYFYPKDDTPGCTKESCAFRDQYEVFKEMGAEVIGISADSPQSHQNFATKYQLPFILLSDSKNEVRNLFGVPSTLFILPGRVTYIIDKEGIVRNIFDSQFDFNGHIEEAIKTLKSL
jgi:peroxiredoxin Q/BCP